MSDPADLSDIETIWADLRDLLAWQQGFGLYLVFADDARRADVLLQALTDWCKEHDLPIQAVRPLKSADALAKVLDALPGNPAVPTMPMWLDLGAWSSDPAWPQVRREILAALNQRRSWLEQNCLRPVFLHLPLSFAPEVVTWAPDLWSIKRYLALLPSANPLQTIQATLATEVTADLASEDAQVAQSTVDMAQLAAHYHLPVPQPGNLQALRDFALAMAAAGQTTSEQGQHADLLACLQDSLAVLRHLRKLAGDTPQAQADVANALLHLAEAHIAAADLLPARTALHAALGLRQRLMASGALASESSQAMIAVLRQLAELETTAGNNKRALVWLENTLPIQRKLAQAQEQSSVALPDLLQTLHSLAEAQASAGQIILADEHRQEARVIKKLLAAERALQDAEALAREDWEANAAALAQRLNDFGVFLAQYGKRVWALQTVARAVKICEDLAAQDFAAYGPALALSLNNWSSRLAEAGEQVPALIAIERAVKIREDLAGQNFAEYGPDLASALNNWSNRLADTGEQLQALAAIERAVKILENLAVQNFAVYGPSLAGSLNNWSLILSDAGDKAQALVSIKRAVKIYEALAAQNFAAHGADLARSLNNWSLRLEDAGEQAQALAAIERAVKIREELARQNPAVHEPELAGCLYNHATLLPALDAIPHLQRAQRLIAPYALPGTNYEKLRQEIELALQWLKAQVAA